MTLKKSGATLRVAMRGTSGIAALALLAGGMGLVYAATPHNVICNGTSTLSCGTATGTGGTGSGGGGGGGGTTTSTSTSTGTGTATGTSTGTKTGTTTGTATTTSTSTSTGTGTTPPLPGCNPSTAPGHECISRHGDTVRGTIVLSRGRWHFIKSHFTFKPGKVRRVRHLVLVGHHRVGHFVVNRPGRLHFVVTFAPKGHPVTLILRFLAQVHRHGRWVPIHTDVKRTTPFNF